jgi:hypothetical protein
MFASWLKNYWPPESDWNFPGNHFGLIFKLSMDWGSAIDLHDP